MASNRRLVIGAMRRRPSSRGAMLCVLLTVAAFCAAPGAAKEEIATVTRTVIDPDGKKTVIEQNYYLDTPDDAPPQFALLVLPGGNGDIRLRRDGAKIVFGQAENLFIKNRRKLHAGGTAVAVLDKGSNRPSGLSVFDRKEPDHAEDLAAVIAHLHARLPGAKVFIAGVGSAGYSIFNLARRAPERIAGGIIIGAPTVRLRTFDFSRVRTRILMLHHMEDLCETSSLIEASDIAARHRFDLVAVAGGEVGRRVHPCNLGSRFALNGNDEEVIELAARWMRGEPVPNLLNAAQPRTPLNERVIRIPTTLAWGSELEKTLYQPDGPGPFPLVLLTHGIPEDKVEMEREKRRLRYIASANEFVKRGMMVAVVLRRGYGMSGSRYNPSSVSNVEAFGSYDADDLRAALDYLVTLPQVDRSRIVVGGQSGGGLATLAFGTRPNHEVKGLLNFAGGLRSTRSDWRELMVNAFGRYGARSKLPSLWFYSANDSFFDHEQAQRAFDAYRQTGGTQARLVKVEAFKRDGHGMFADADGVPLWWPETEKFLLEIGMLR